MNTQRLRKTCQREGQILIMTVLGITVLAGMAFYVYNTGVQVNDRVAMQGAADSAAISGTVWMARSMNVVAMNNVDIAKLLASVVVLDSLPMATDMSLAEVTAWQAAMQAQILSLPAINTKIPNSAEQALLAAALSVLNNRMTNEINILTPVDAALNNSGFNMALTTNWSVTAQQGAQAQQGTLWQAILALGQFSGAAKASCGELAQANAFRYGTSDMAAVAFVVPVLPVMPAVQGAFGDFQPLLCGSEGVTSNTASVTMGPGGPGGAIPDMVYPHRLGPYARLLRWRNPWTQTVGATSIPPSGNASGVPGDGGVGSQGPSFGGGSTGGTTLTFGYWTYGPVAWAMNNLGWWSNGNGTNANFGNLPDTHFRQYMSQLTTFKLNYMFSANPPPQLQQIHEPVIISDYGAAKQAAANPRTPPYMTYYFCVRIISSVPEGSGQWLQSNTCWTNVPGFGYDPSVTPVFTGFAGWLDMDTLVGGANPNPQQPGQPAAAVWTRLGNYVWKETATGTSTSWPQIGINQKLDGNGNPIPHPLYFVEFRIFGGLDVGPMVNVSDPCDGLESTIAGQVFPLKLDISQGDYDPTNPNADTGIRRTKFTFLGVAQHGASSSFWPNQFQPANPSGNMVTVAQAELFNNTSWDLWTQDWRAQMVPVSQWDDWTAQMAAGAPDASATNGLVQPSQVSDVATYLQRLNSQTVESYIHH